MKMTIIIVVMIIVCAFAYGFFNHDKSHSDVNKNVIDDIQIPSPLPPTPSLETLHQDPVQKTFKYTLRGQEGIISVTMYGGTLRVIRGKDNPVLCYKSTLDTTPCSYDEHLIYYNKFVEELNQQEVLEDIALQIKNKTSNKDDQVRIAVSLVQNIPYVVIDHELYPYETLYNGGVCQDKSFLLTALLSKLGYGSEIMVFPDVNHMAVGVLSNRHTYTSRYAFVETTSPSIITDYSNEYEGVGELSGVIHEYKISEGDEMTTLLEEYNDASELRHIRRINSHLDSKYYNKWKEIVWKYGLEVSSELSESYVTDCVISQNGVCVSS